MSTAIRLGSDQDLDALVDLSLLAWQPVFESFLQIMGPAIFSSLYPDWKVVQSETVRTYCQARENRVLLIAEVDGEMAGFLVYDLHQENKKGEVTLLAVHPAYQNRGVGTQLNKLALQQMKESGMKVAEVATGGDPGHAPARRSYEKAGYLAMPLVLYLKEL
jgi:GNAT superfamily N-acetyltransferase